MILPLYTKKTKYENFGVLLRNFVSHKCAWALINYFVCSFCDSKIACRQSKKKTPLQNGEIRNNSPLFSGTENKKLNFFADYSVLHGGLIETPKHRRPSGGPENSPVWYPLDIIRRTDRCHMWKVSSFVDRRSRNVRVVLS